MFVRLLRLVVVVPFLFATALTGPSAHAGGGHTHPVKPRCVAVQADGVGQDNGDFTTTADVSVAGVPVGATAASFTPTGVTGSVVSFTGSIRFTGLGGTLSAPVTGTLDTATGAFASTAAPVTGAGALSRVTGALNLAGVENLSTGVFTEKITGSLCTAAQG